MINDSFEAQPHRTAASAVYLAFALVLVCGAWARAQEASSSSSSSAVSSAASSSSSSAAAASSSAAPASMVKSEPAAPAGGAEFVGADTCISCHQDKATFHDALHARSFAGAKGIDFQHSCETCHGPGSLHAAAAGDKSNPGFATIKNFKKMSAAQVSETCFQCHEDQGRMHWVGSKHETHNVACVTCHSIHNPQQAKLLLVKPRVDQVCAQCHSDIVARTRRSNHMPIVEGKMDCTSCHNPHGSATPKALKAASVNDTCLSCHVDKRGPFLWEHPPVREDCMNCHDPHGSHNDKMLVAREPFLCQRCHDSQRHPSTPYDFTSLQGGANKIMAGACTNCHQNIHGSSHPSGRVFTR